MARKLSKKQKVSFAKVDRTKRVTVEDACKLVKDSHYTKFDETVDVAVRLGVDPKHADQMVRGAIVLPNGIGKTLRVVVFAKGDKEREAREAGADFVGAEDLVKKITEENWMDFDTAVATPDMMGQVGKLGRVLGPRGLMPNPKTGTVTMDVARAVREAKAGKVEYRVEKAGIVHAPVGKVSFPMERLAENVHTLLEAIVRAKPASAKGTYLRSITLSSTMGPGVRVDPMTLPVMQQA